MRELELPKPDGGTYSIGKLGPMDQWKITKRFMAQVKRNFDRWTREEKIAGRNPKEGDFSEPSLEFTLSEMSDEDSGIIIATALSAVQKKQDGGAWAPVLAPGTTRIQFAEMQQEAMIALTVAVIMDNITSFFPSGQPNSPA